MTWKNRITGHGEEAPDQLLANDKNWRIHTQEQQDALTGALSEIGWLQDVIINKRTSADWPDGQRNVETLVDGHLRVKLALRYEQPLIPVKYVDLTPNEEALALMTIDPISAMAKSDIELAARLAAEAHTNSPALKKLIGQTIGNKNPFGMEGENDDPTGKESGSEEDESEEKETSEDKLAALQEKWETKPGQIWQIESKKAVGKFHRIQCGDSTSRADVLRLFGEETPMLMVTDPPYGVNYDPKWRVDWDERMRSTGKVQNDDVVDWTEAFRLFPGNVAYVWHAGKFAGEVADQLKAVDFVIRSQIIWCKPNFVISRGHYHWMHEPLWYAVRRGENGNWQGDRKQATIWHIENNQAGFGKADDASKEEFITGHGTQKPVECMRRPILNNSLPGDMVYDPFMGSGTTIVAAESVARVACGNEIDPQYVAAILERVTNLGLEVKLVNE